MSTVFVSAPAGTTNRLDPTMSSPPLGPIVAVPYCGARDVHPLSDPPPGALIAPTEPGTRASVSAVGLATAGGDVESDAAQAAPNATPRAVTTAREPRSMDILIEEGSSDGEGEMSGATRTRGRLLRRRCARGNLD